MEVNFDDPSVTSASKRSDGSPVPADNDIKHRLKMKLVSRQRLPTTDAVPSLADISTSSTSAGASMHHEKEEDLLQTAGHSKRTTSANSAQYQYDDHTPVGAIAEPSSPGKEAGNTPGLHTAGFHKVKSTDSNSARDQPVSKEEDDDEYQLNVYFEDVSKNKQDHQEEGTAEIAPAEDWQPDKDTARSSEQEVKEEPDAVHDGSVSLNTPQPGRACVRGSAKRGQRLQEALVRQKKPSPRVAALGSLPFTVVTGAEALSSLVQSYASSGSVLPNLLCNIPVSTAAGSSSSPSLSLLCVRANTAASQTVDNADKVSLLPSGVASSGGVATVDAFSQSQMFLGNPSSLPALSQLVAERVAPLLSSVSAAGLKSSGTPPDTSQSAGTGDAATAPPQPPASADNGSNCSVVPQPPQICESSATQAPPRADTVTSAPRVEVDGPSAASLSATGACNTTSSSSAPVMSIGTVPSSQPQTPLHSGGAAPCPPQLVVYNVTPLLVLPEMLFNSMQLSSSQPAENSEEEDADEDFTVIPTDKLPTMPCNKCSETFETFQALRKHMKSHVQRAHKCDECGKLCTGTWQLRKHKMSHVKDKKFDCAVCQKTFDSRGALDEHMQSHPDEKPHVCDVCSEGFCSASLLSKHKKQHTSPKHTCNVCNMTFDQGTKLKEHKKTHASPSRAASKEVLCAQCGKKFNNARGLSHHICKEKRQPYDSRTCSTCKKTFPSRISLQIHVHSTHMDTSECFSLDKNFFSEHKESAKRVKKTAPNSERFVCPVCGKVLKSLSTLHVHERVHKRPFLCKTCNKGFSHYYQLKRHQHVHTGIKDFTCEICEKKFISSQTLKLHYIGIHLGDKPFVCQVCNQGFVTRHTLNLHQLTHSDRKPFTCDICGRSFKYESVLKNHRLLHLGDRPFKCDICDKAYVCSNYLNKHKRRAHSDPKYTCDVCGKACYFANELKNHKLIHTEDRPYSCEVCSKAFHTVLRLKNHKRIHSEEKPYSCNLCDKVFASVGILNSHNRRVHCGKSFTCEVCKKAFKHYYSLKDHMNVHLQLKNFVCEECGKDFYSNSALNTHKRLKHMEHERHFVCNVCGKSFPFQSYLKVHEKIHTKEKTLVCELCNKAVKYKLSRHMKRVHNYVKP